MEHGITTVDSTSQSTHADAPRPSPPPSLPPLWQRIADTVNLTIASLVLLVTILINVLAGRSGSKQTGFVNHTGRIANLFQLQVTPSGWSFGIWGLIYFWQALWLLYAWSFVFRRTTPCTVSCQTLLLYTCSNINNINWIYLWGNSYPQVAFPFAVLILVFLASAVVIEIMHVNKLTPALQTRCEYKIDLWITRLLVINGMVVYATYLTVGALLNFGVILQYFADVSPITTGAVIVWLATVTVLAYFALENTVLKHSTRFIFIVYPTLIWVLSGVLSAHWGREDPNTNPVLTHLLLLLVITLFIARVGITVFPLLRSPVHSCK